MWFIGDRQQTDSVRRGEVRQQTPLARLKTEVEVMYRIHLRIASRSAVIPDICLIKNPRRNLKETAERQVRRQQLRALSLETR